MQSFGGRNSLFFFLVVALIAVNTDQLTLKEPPKKRKSFAKELHQLLMPYFWILLSNVLIYLAGLRHKRHFYIYHGILFSIIIVVTIATSFPVLLEEGFSRRPFHYILGAIIWALMVAQLTLGTFQSFIKNGLFRTVISFDLHKISQIHKLLGIIMYIAIKISVIERFKNHMDKLISFVLWEICFLAFLFWKKSNSKINDLKTRAESFAAVRNIKNLNELKFLNKSFGLYLNYVFDLTQLKQIHPGGKQMIREIHSSSFDKYLYGIQSSYQVLSSSPHQHSKHCFQLLKQPIAILSIKSPYHIGFQETISKVKVSTVVKLSQNLYELRLKKIEGFQFEYSGYSSLNQFGRFYTIQDGNKLSRLYTAVNFLSFKNVEFLKGHKFYKYNNEIQEHFNNEMQSIDNITQNRSQELSLLIKKYEKGKFTYDVQLFRDRVFNISSQCGEGLGLENVNPGHIIVFVGGTGIFPFCDLIDTLYQEHLLNYQHSLGNSRYQGQNNKIIQQKMLNNFSFEFYGSFGRLQEIHYITANQIAYLTKNSDKFSFLYNLDTRPSIECMNILNIKLTQQRFEKIVTRSDFSHEFSKIFVCGPQKLRKKLYQSLQFRFPQDKFKIL